jgi:hypothetical protein
LTVADRKALFLHSGNYTSIYKGLVKPLKMELTEGSETSAKLNMTPGTYPKEKKYNKYLNLTLPVALIA